MKFALVLSILSAVLLTATQSEAKDIRIGGGAAPINNIFRRVKDAYESQSSHKLILQEQGPDIALMDLDQGKLDLATAGLPYNDWLKLLEEKKYSAKNKANFKVRVIGRDLIQVYSSTDVPVKELSKAQLRDIFTGKATNWKQVGGPDLPIKVVFGSKIPGTNKVWQKEIMDGGNWVSNMINVETAPDIAKTLVATKGSIGIGPIGLNTKDTPVATVKIPEVGRPIVAATVGQPSPEVMELFDFLTKQGKEFTK